MATATVNGTGIHYLQRGGGEPLLLIMGMSGTHLSWGEPFLALLERDFEVTIFDNRGVGRSSRAEPGYEIADLADDTAALVEALGHESMHVLGISMGGMVAQQLAVRHPGRIRTLTLGCTYSGGEGSALSPPEVFERLAASWRSGDRERALRTGWEVNVSERFAANDEAYAAFRTAALDLPVPIPVIMGQLQAIGRHDVAGRLGEIDAPTLVIHGTDDQMLPVSNGHMIAERVPGARLEILDGVGHLFWVEEPERTATLLREHTHRGSDLASAHPAE
jgi:pimeloyl-ACP methyl ester carboxylesterase